MSVSIRTLGIDRLSVRDRLDVVFEDRVEVLAVLHGARDVSTWQSRARNGG